MATSGIFSTTNQYIKYQITVTEGTIDTQNNNSPISVVVRFWRTNTGYTTYGSGTVYCKINGVTYSANVGSSQKITYYGINLFSKTVTIPHNADGSKTVYVSAWIDHSQVHSNEQGFDVTLTTVPRATTPTFSASTADMGQTVTIILNRLADSFTHSLSYSFGSLTNKTDGLHDITGIATSTTITPPIDLAAQLPTATSGTLTLMCKTYNGASLVGTKTASLKVNIPATVKPAFGMTPIAITDTVPGISAKFAGLVQNISKPKITVAAAGVYNSAITGYKITIDGQTANVNNATFEKLISSGTVTVTAVITDSRGRTNTATINVLVLPYSPPTISTFRAFRCDSDGTENPEGTNVNIEFAFAISAVNNLNDKQYKINYRKTNETNWTTLKSENIYSANTNYMPTVIFTADDAYELQLEVADYVSTINANVEIASTFSLIDLRSTGKGVEFGDVAKEDCFGVSMDAKFRKNLNVVGNFSASNIKFGSGTIVPVANTPTRAQIMFDEPFPEGTIPKIFITTKTNSPGVQLLGISIDNPTATGFYAWVNRTNTIETNFDWIAIG